MEISPLYNDNFVTDEEVITSGEFAELKRKLVSEKANNIVDHIEYIILKDDDITVYKIKNMDEWDALYICFTDLGYKFEDEVEVSFDNNKCCYVIDHPGYDYLLVYNPKTIMRLRDDLQNQLSFISD